MFNEHFTQRSSFAKKTTVAHDGIPKTKYEAIRYSPKITDKKNNRQIEMKFQECNRIKLH